MIDQLNDSKHKYLVSITQDRPDLVDRYKTASLTDRDKLPKTAFADSDRRRFPMHTESHTVLSKLYAEKQASKVPDRVMNKLDNMLELHGHSPDEYKTSEKTASTGESTRYLLPQYQRLSVSDKSDVKTASQKLLSERGKLKRDTMVDASVRTVKVAADMGMSKNELDPEIYKYAGMTTCDAGDLLDWVEARASACTKGSDRKMFDKMANTIKSQFPPNGVIDSRDELIKIASYLEEADKEAGLDKWYGSRLKDPMETVFNTDKVAEETVDLGGNKVPLSSMASIPGSVYEEILGEGVMDSVGGADGGVDPEQLKAMLETLPADLKSLLHRTIAPHIRS